MSEASEVILDDETDDGIVRYSPRVCLLILTALVVITDVPAYLGLRELGRVVFG